MIAVSTTNIGLYFVKLEKYAKPNVPRPRDANIRLPPQHRAANVAGITEKILSSFSFIY